MISGCTSQLREEPELQLFPTKIDINKWDMETPPEELLAEKIVNDPRKKLFEEYHVLNFYRATYSGGEGKADITYDVIIAETPLDAYSLMRRIRTSIDIYDPETDSYLNNRSVLMSRGKFIIEIRADNEYESIRDDMRSVTQFLQQKTGKKIIPGEAIAFVKKGDGPVLYRNPIKEFYDSENFYLGNISDDEKTMVLYWIKDDENTASSLYDKILKSQRGIVTESSSVRSFYYIKDDKYFVFVQKEHLVLGVLYVKSQGDGKKTAMNLINRIYDVSTGITEKENN